MIGKNEDPGRLISCSFFRGKKGKSTLKVSEAEGNGIAGSALGISIRNKAV